MRVSGARVTPLLTVWSWMPWVHLPAMLWGAATEFFHLVCPLTPLENHLRRQGGGETYSGDFIERYLVPIIYPEALTQELQLLLGSALLLFNIVVYAYLWRRAWPRAV